MLPGQIDHYLVLHPTDRKQDIRQIIPVGRLVVYLPSEKYELVSWDDGIPIKWKITNVPDHQPVMYD